MLYLRHQDEKEDAKDVISRVLKWTERLSSTAFCEFGKGIENFMRNLSDLLHGSVSMDDDLYTSNNPLLQACVDFWALQLENKYREFYPFLSNCLDSKMNGVVDDTFVAWLKEQDNGDTEKDRQRPTILNILAWIRHLLLTSGTNGKAIEPQVQICISEIIRGADVIRRLRNEKIYAEGSLAPTSVLQFLEEIQGLVFSVGYFARRPILGILDRSLHIEQLHIDKSTEHEGQRQALYSVLQTNAMQLYCGVHEFGSSKFDLNRWELVRTKGQERVETFVDRLYLRPQYKTVECVNGSACTTRSSCPDIHSESEKDFVEYLMSLCDNAFFRNMSHALDREREEKMIADVDSADMQRYIEPGTRTHIAENISAWPPVRASNGEGVSSIGTDSAHVSSASGGSTEPTKPGNIVAPKLPPSLRLIFKKDPIGSIRADLVKYFHIQAKFFKVVNFDTAEKNSARCKSTVVNNSEFYKFCAFAFNGECRKNNCVHVHRLVDMIFLSPVFKTAVCRRKACEDLQNDPNKSFQPMLCGFYHSELEGKLLDYFREVLCDHDPRWRNISVSFKKTRSTLSDHVTFPHAQ
eukprot:Clim_evm1s60 gene=Clim_evmTU1s60